MFWYCILIIVVSIIAFTLLAPEKKVVIAFSGVSGSGKTTIARALAEEYNAAFIDLDDYFYPKEQLPKATLSNGKTITLYDSYDSINWQWFWSDIKRCNADIIFVAGFCLPIEHSVVEFDYHIHLKLDKATCKQRRIMSKKLSEEKIVIDSLEVDEFVYPFYEENYIVKGSVNQLIDEVLDATLPLDELYAHVDFILNFQDLI